jgi:hypothetical protein
MSRHVIANVPYIFAGITPRCHVTSLRTVLEYYGVKYSPSYLMNLSGFNYGFRYSKEGHIAFPIPNPPLGPWEFMAYAAEKIGCRTELIKDKPWDETWEMLKSYIDKDVPVLIARLNMKSLWKVALPVPHLVVLCGYDEDKGVVMIHDSALGEVGEGVQYLHTSQLHEKSGNYAEFSISDFEEAFDLAGTPFKDFGKYGFVIVQPPTIRPTISWVEILERNAKLTLGKVEEVISKKLGGNYLWGPEGILEYANDLEQGFGLLDQSEELITRLTASHLLTFELGSSYKMDAHAFVAGLAALSNNQDLEQAAYYLRFTALMYEQGLAHMNLITLKNQSISQEELKSRLAEIAEVLRRASESERKAGEMMSQGVTTLQSVPV